MFEPDNENDPHQRVIALGGEASKLNDEILSYDKNKEAWEARDHQIQMKDASQLEAYITTLQQERDAVLNKISKLHALKSRAEKLIDTWAELFAENDNTRQQAFKLVALDQIHAKQNRADLKNFIRALESEIKVLNPEPEKEPSATHEMPASNNFTENKQEKEGTIEFTQEAEDLIQQINKVNSSYDPTTHEARMKEIARTLNSLSETSEIMTIDKVLNEKNGFIRELKVLLSVSTKKHWLKMLISQAYGLIDRIAAYEAKNKKERFISERNEQLLEMYDSNYLDRSLDALKLYVMTLSVELENKIEIRNAAKSAEAKGQSAPSATAPLLSSAPKTSSPPVSSIPYGFFDYSLAPRKQPETATPQASKSTPETQTAESQVPTKSSRGPSSGTTTG